LKLQKGWVISQVDMQLSDSDLELPFEDFCERYVRPAYKQLIDECQFILDHPSDCPAPGSPSSAAKLVGMAKSETSLEQKLAAAQLVETLQSVALPAELLTSPQGQRDWMLGVMDMAKDWLMEHWNRSIQNSQQPAAPSSADESGR
jgi:hypothetical protein